MHKLRVHSATRIWPVTLVDGTHLSPMPAALSICIDQGSQNNNTVIDTQDTGLYAQLQVANLGSEWPCRGGPPLRQAS